MYKKRTVFLSLFVISLFIGSATVASAAPGGGGAQKYYVNGYVKSTSGDPISGATVKLYLDGKYINTVYSQSNGYFSGSTYSLIIPRTWKAVVSKSGYLSNTKTVSADPDRSTYMGIISLTLAVPPPQPTISGVYETGEGMSVGVEYDVSWGYASTGYEVKFYWSQDEIIGNDDDHVLTHGGQPGIQHYVESDLPMIWTDSEYWFEIRARSQNAAGWSSTDVFGPQNLELKYFPTHDATVDSANPDTPSNNDILIAQTGGQGPEYRQPVLRFSVPGGTAVKSATLRMWSHSVDINGHGDIYVYDIANSYPEVGDPIINREFQEDLVSWNSLSDWVGTPGSFDSTPNVGGWDEWDVTEFIPGNGEIAITIRVWKIIYSFQGAEYYSKDYFDREKWPHLVVEYYGTPEEEPSLPTEFVSDIFSNPQINDAWFTWPYSNPPFDYELGATMLIDYYSINEGGWLVFDSPDPFDTDGYSGYTFEQDGLSISEGFQFECQIAMTGSVLPVFPEIQLGVELLSEGDNVAEMYFFLDEDFASPNTGVYARVGDAPVWEMDPLPMGLDGFGGLFELKRDPSSSAITLTWYEGILWPTGGHVLIEREINDQTIDEVRLKILALGSSYDHWTAGFDFIKQIPLIDLGNPENNHQPLLEPVYAYGFDDMTQIYAGWDNGLSTGEPLGGLSESDILIEGSHSLWVQESDSLQRYWSIVQTLDTPENLKFDINSLHNRWVSFSFGARYSNTLSRVRAMIEYQQFGESSTVTVAGDWVRLENDGSWNLVSVRTSFPIPDDVYLMRVWIVGESVHPSDDFSAYIDQARLAIVTDSNIPKEYIYGQYGPPSEKGEVSICLNVLESYIDGTSDFHVKLAGLIDAESTDGNIIRAIEVRWQVYGSEDIHTENEALATSGKYYEENDEDYGGESTILKRWNTICEIWRNPWVSIGTSLVIAGGLKYFGVDYPLSTIASSSIKEGISYLLTPRYPGFDDHTANYQQDGYLDMLYPWDVYPESSYNVQKSRVGLELQWTVNHNDGPIPPGLRLDFVVHWALHGIPDDTLVTTHSMIVMFQT